MAVGMTRYSTVAENTLYYSIAVSTLSFFLSGMSLLVMNLLIFLTKCN